MRSRAGPVVLGACIAIGLLSLVLVARSDERTLAFTIDVRALGTPVVRPGKELCQTGIEREAAFDTVVFVYGTFHRPGPRMAVTILDSATGRTLAAGVLPAGYPDNRPAATRVFPAVRSGRFIDACVRNIGSRSAAVYGGPDGDSLSTTATIGRNGRYLGGDLTVSFHNSHPRSVLSLVPAIFRRASIFFPGWAGAWTFWVLLGALTLGVPALLVRALGAAARGTD